MDRSTGKKIGENDASAFVEMLNVNDNVDLLNVSCDMRQDTWSMINDLIELDNLIFLLMLSKMTYQQYYTYDTYL